MKRVIKSWILVGLPIILLAIGAAVVSARLSGDSTYHGLLRRGALLLAALALGCEYVDSTLGMGLWHGLDADSPPCRV